MGKHCLSIDNISKSYHQKQIVRSVSFSVQSGDIIGLLGPNGAGKTTCFYIASGLLRPDSGTIRLDNKNISKLSIDKRALLGIGYLAQEPSIFRTLTVSENILSALEVLRLKRNARYAQLQTLLKEFNIEHIKHAKGIRLSGGERRRVEIARIVAIKPKFILLDEPFAGIDPIAVKDLQQLIVRLSEQEIGIFITDHNFREMLDTCQKTYVISAGAIVAYGDKNTILSSAAVKQTYLGHHSYYE